MNWQYIKNTGPNYWRYQSPIILIMFFFSFLNVWALFNDPEAFLLPMARLSVYGAITLFTYQSLLVLLSFHVIFRGLYKYYKAKATTKLKLFWLITLSSIVCTLTICAFDLLPIVLSITPYSVSEYLSTYSNDFTNGLTLYFFSNIYSTIAWGFLYAVFAGISNYKQLALLLKKQELQMLTNRINPEFLFNTMQAIKHQIDIDEEQAADLVTKASDLFRYNLMSSKTPIATLTDEIKSLENYLELLEKHKHSPCSNVIKLYEQEQAPAIPSMSLIFICSFLQNTARKINGKLSISGFIKHQTYRLEISHQSYGKFFLDTELFDNVKERLEHIYNANASIVLIRRGRCRRVIIELPIE